MSESEPIRALIVDDEAPARRILAEYLAEVPEVEVVGECQNGFEALQAVDEQRVDLLFLDVQMPKLGGFDVVELLGDASPAIVFVTAYDEYAVAAFEVHALDYLLKPFSAERLREAVERVKAQLREPPAVPAAELPRAASPEHRERVLVRDGPRIHVVAVTDLDYVEAQDDYVVLKTGEGKLRKQQTLGELAASLDPDRFLRIHRSYLLNVDRLARIELYAKDSRVAILKDGTRLPVSRTGYARLRELL